MRLLTSIHGLTSLGSNHTEEQYHIESKNGAQSWHKVSVSGTSSDDGQTTFIFEVSCASNILLLCDCHSFIFYTRSSNSPCSVVASLPTVTPHLAPSLLTPPPSHTPRLPPPSYLAETPTMPELRGKSAFQKNLQKRTAEYEKHQVKIKQSQRHCLNSKGVARPRRLFWELVAAAHIQLQSMAIKYLQMIAIQIGLTRATLSLRDKIVARCYHQWPKSHPVKEIKYKRCYHQWSKSHSVKEIKYKLIR